MTALTNEGNQNIAYILLADGFEEIEALAPADIFSRAGMDVKLIGVTGAVVTGSHGIKVQTDITLADAEANVKLVYVPGGSVGVEKLCDTPEVFAFVSGAYEIGGNIAAICAGPAVLGGAGLLSGKRVTCYPGFENRLNGAIHEPSQYTVQDGRIFTARGAGVSMEFAFEIVSALYGADKADELRKVMQCRC